MFRTTTRRNRNRRRSLGMTLLEIMIVLAILALVMGLLVGPRLFAAFTESRGEIARQQVKKIAGEAYSQWAIKPSNAGKCPSGDELAQFSGQKELKDPWGNAYMFRCTDLPPGAQGIAVWSMGEDGKDGTGDDLKSWE